MKTTLLGTLVLCALVWCWGQRPVRPPVILGTLMSAYYNLH